MDIFAEAIVSFAAMALLLTHLSNKTFRRLVGYKGYVDVVLHGSVMFLFFGTSTDGLIQAEAAAILFSVWLRVYAYCYGFERVRNFKWVRVQGRFSA